MNISTDAYLTACDQPSNNETWLASMLAPFQRLGAYMAQRRTRSRQISELYRFTDRELWDVGLSRSDILAIEHGVYRRD